MPVAAVTTTMTPPRASTSRTRWPLAMPPMAGLQDIWAMSSSLRVKSAVRSPMRAAAMAASTPAWPPPTTTISYRSGGIATILRGVLVAAGAEAEYYGLCSAAQPSGSGVSHAYCRLGSPFVSHCLFHAWTGWNAASRLAVGKDGRDEGGRGDAGAGGPDGRRRRTHRDRGRTRCHGADVQRPNAQPGRIAQVFFGQLRHARAAVQPGAAAHDIRNRAPADAAGHGGGAARAEEPGRGCLLQRAPAGGAGADQAGFVGGADADVFGAAASVLSDAAFRHHVHRGAGAGPGERGGP